MQVVLDAQGLEPSAGSGIELAALTTVAHVDFIDVLHQIQRLGLSDVLVQGAAKIVGDVILANAPAPPKPLMMEQHLQPMQVLIFSPSMGQWRLFRA